MQQPVHIVTHVYRAVFDTHSVACLGAEARVVCAVLMSCNSEAAVERADLLLAEAVPLLDCSVVLLMVPFA